MLTIDLASLFICVSRACRKYPGALLLVEEVRRGIVDVDDELLLNKYLNALETQFLDCKRRRDSEKALNSDCVSVVPESCASNAKIAD